MAKAAPKITLSPSHNIPFDRLLLSQSNVRRTRPGENIGELADDIARRGLLQSLNARPELDGQGQETGRFEIPAGGRRFRALELLVKQKRLAKDAPIPCIVRAVDAGILAEDDSLAENLMRENLHPLDQFNGMRAMVDNGDDVEAIAAHYFTTPAVVRQRLKLASVSPMLHQVYADDEMSLDQLMAFTVSDDHARQQQVWELLATSFNRSPAYIRQKLTENSVRVADKRVRFVTVDAYVKAGGSVVRDLFEADNGGWLTDPALLDRLVAEKLETEAGRIGEEGWKWVTAAIDVPWDANRSMRAIDAEISALSERPQIFELEEVTNAGVFVSIDHDGTLRIERGFVKAEDEAEHEFHAKLHSFNEAIELALTALLLILVGATFPRLFGELDWAHAAIAFGLLFVVRPVAGWVSLLRTGLPSADRLVIAFYGVRGIGSIYYLAYAASHLELVNEG